MESLGFCCCEMQTAVNQDRHRFVDKLAKGKNDVIAIADLDEWDNFGDPDAKGNYNTWLSTPEINLKGNYNTWLSTPEINLKGIEANSITLT